MLRFSSCLFKLPVLNIQSPLIGQLTQTWTSTTNNNWAAAVLDQFLWGKLATRHKLCKRFCADFDLFNYRDLLHAQGDI